MTTFAWWGVFGVLVVGLLAVDQLVFHRPSRKDTTRRALLWSVIWIGLGLGFSVVVADARGHDAALAYLTAYLIEESLSIDNLFVFLALFTYFGVAEDHRRRVLFWGILGAIVLRGAFIFAGVALIARFQWLIYLLGAVLVATGARLGLSDGEETHPERNFVVRWASRVLPMEPAFHGDRFVIRTARGRRFTALFLVVLAVETTDLMFAVDSVPAVLAVSRDPFVVYTSNIFAVLGLRALFFVLAGALGALRFLRPALAVILVLVGAKMLISGFVTIPTETSLLVVAGILAVATVASLVFPAPKPGNA